MGEGPRAEPGRVRDVPRRPDAAVRDRAQRQVRRHAPRGMRHTRRIEPQRRDPRRAPDGNKKMRPGHARPVREAQRDPLRVRLRGDDGGAFAQFDAVRRQGIAQRGDAFRFLAPRYGALLHHRDAAAEPRMRLRHLEPDRPAAEHDQVAGRRIEPEQRLVGQVGQVGQARDGRDDGGGSRGDDGAAEGEAPSRGLDRVAPREAGMGAHHRHAHGGEAFLGIVRGDGGDGAVHMGAHARPVDLGRGQAHAVAMRAPRLGRRMRRGEQRLGGHAAEVQAVAAHLATLEQRGLEAETRRDGRDRQPGRPRPDHRHVEVRHRVSSCATRRRPGRAPPARAAAAGWTERRSPKGRARRRRR